MSEVLNFVNRWKAWCEDSSIIYKILNINNYTVLIVAIFQILRLKISTRVLKWERNEIPRSIQNHRRKGITMIFCKAFELDKGRELLKSIKGLGQPYKKNCRQWISIDNIYQIQSILGYSRKLFFQTWGQCGCKVNIKPTQPRFSNNHYFPLTNLWIRLHLKNQNCFHSRD